MEIGFRFDRGGWLAPGVANALAAHLSNMIDELVDLAGGKKPSGSARPLASRAAAQSEVARAEATLRSARAFYYEAIETAWQEALGGSLSTESRRDIRLATTHATHASAEAVDRMFHLGGGTSVYRTSPLQRIFRDVHVATQHMMIGPSTYELTGRLYLGLDTDVAML